MGVDLKPNPKNPRIITDARLAQLKKSLHEFGDISGIVFNRTTGQLATGHQRNKDFDENTKVKITKTYDMPTRTGTVAVGYILHNGERFSYREVAWPKHKEMAANIAANKNAGEWNLDQLKADFQELASFDVDFDLELTMFDPGELGDFGITTTVREHERLLGGNEDIDDEIPVEEEIEEPAKLEGQVQLFNADNLEVMKGIAENTFDSVVTDPPYGWRFMGKAWDGEDIQKRATEEFNRPPRKDGKSRGQGDPSMAAGLYDQSLSANQAFQKFSNEWAKEAFRILKPGGHIIVFCGPRTYHRMATGVEDAGFEIRDQLQWLFGSGFPKSLDISKAIDRAAGAEREVVSDNPNNRPSKRHGAAGFDGEDNIGSEWKANLKITEPSTDEAKQWDGWGTALKPANEPILLARKPISEKTVAANVLKWGTGGLNIGACRIPTGPEGLTKGGCTKMGGIFGNDKAVINAEGHVEGRFPANLILDETAAAMLDEQTGKSKSPPIGSMGGGSSSHKVYGGGWAGEPHENGYGDTGGASRFFYVAKSSKSEKNMHCRELPEKFSPTMGKGIGKREHDETEPRAYNNNNHPTVKPVSLMRYLCRLVTPANGLVLDPFLGSGTTGVAALKEEFRFVGIEREADYFKICRKRLNYSHTKFDFIKPRVKTIIRKKAAEQES